ncbi:MAG: SIMPL domain-containing protein [Chloroflexaceae bacterium]|nr:SIMPL domain-containing protein [Chloroflexaceae bacterium]
MMVHRRMMIGWWCGLLVLLAALAPLPVAQAQVVRQVTVIGQGEVTAIPDTAYIWIGVETTDASAQVALEQNSIQTATIIGRLQELGIAATDIQTQNFSVYPNYDQNGQQIVGYTVQNTVGVTIRNLAQAGVLVDQVVALGANRVSGISFGVDNPAPLLDEARALAMADARRKAEQLAGLAGAQLGQVLVITENIGAPPPIVRGVPEASDAAVPIEPGEQQFTVQLQVTFELQ